MIKAIKGGVMQDFSDRSWELLKGCRDGWQEVKDFPPEEKIPVQEVVLEKKVDLKVEEKKDPTIDEMKTFLKSKGVKFHHKLGDEKIKSLYNENRE